jgi:hypothetical protein
MFARYFKPGCIVRCTLNNIELLTVTATGLLPRNNPHVTFEVTKSLTPAPDTATVEIMNLAEARRKLLTATIAENGEFQIELLAGYDGQMMRLFRGRVRNFRGLDRRGGDLVSTFVADDGGDILTEVKLSLSQKYLNAATMVELAIQAYAQLGGIPLQKHPTVDQITGPLSSFNFTVVSASSAAAILDEAARICKARWWVADGILYMAYLRQPVDPIANVLPSTHWLAPPSQDGSGLVRVPTFCNPLIKPGGQVQLLPEGSESPYQLSVAGSDVAGVYRVETAAYAGDTEGQAPWSASLALRSLR